MSATVSVVVPTFNRAALLDETLASIAAQTLAPMEIIVADDGSTEDTRAVAQRHGAQFLPLAHAGRPAPARNAGMRSARGEWIALCDSDDLWLSDKLQRQLAHAQADPRAGLIAGNATRFDETGERGAMLPPAARLFRHADGPGLAALLGGNFIINSTALFRRDLLERAGYLDEAPALRAVEDYDHWLRLALVTGIGYLDAPLVRYREHAANITLKARGAAPARWREAHLHIYALARRRLLAHGADARLWRAFERGQRGVLRECVRALAADGRHAAAAALALRRRAAALQAWAGMAPPALAEGLLSGPPGSMQA